MQNLGFSFLFFFFATFTMHAQSVFPELKNDIDLSSVVVEGKIVKQSCFYDEASHDIYTTNYLVFRKVFKGDIDVDTLKFLTLGGVVGETTETVSHAIHLNFGDEGVFLLRDSKDIEGELEILDYLAQVKDKEAYLFGRNQAFISWNLVITEIGKICHTDVASLLNDDNETSGLVTGVLLDTCIITSVVVDPEQVSVGTGQTITITGSGFGDIPDSSYIVAPNAENGGYSTISLAGDSHNFKDGTSWTNNSIVMEVEGEVHPQYNVVFSTIGSGKFTIKPPSTVSEPCHFYVEIDYSLAAVYAYDEFRTTGLVRRKSKVPDGKRHWNILTPLPQELLDQGISFEDIEAVATDVYCEWEMATGVDYVYDGPTTTRDGSDRIFTIYYKSISPTILMVTTTQTVTACGSYPKYFSGYKTNADIAVNHLLKWYVSTGTNIGSNQFDFYSAFAHEVGHSLGLGHSMDSNLYNGNNDSRMMYFATDKGLLKRNIDAESADGVKWLVEKTLWSMNTSAECFNSTALDFQTVPLNTPCLTPVNEIKKTCNFLKENIVHQGDLLNVNLNFSSNSQVILYNTFGQIVFHSKGNGLLEVPTGNLPKGIYYLHTFCQKTPQIAKVLIL